MKAVTLLLAACLLAGASAKIVMIGDSFSDNGHGANPVVMDALSTSQVWGLFCAEPGLPLYEHACMQICASENSVFQTQRNLPIDAVTTLLRRVSCLSTPQQVC